MALAQPDQGQRSHREVDRGTPTQNSSEIAWNLASFPKRTPHRSPNPIIRV
jgi:hypothetical protein